MKVSLKELDEWLFRGLGGIINMLVTRTGYNFGFSKACKLMVNNELRRLTEVNQDVNSRQTANYPTDDASFSVLDTWFIRSYQGINNWLDTRLQDGPPMTESHKEELREHIKKIGELIDKGRRDPHDEEPAR